MRILPVVALILVSAFWGIHAVVGKTVESQLDPFELTFLRFTFGAVIYAPFVPRILRLSQKMLWQLGLTGFLWAVLYPIFFYQSLRFITPVESLLLINTAPLIAALLGWLVLGEGIRLIHGIGIGIAFLGVAWTTVGQWKTTGSVTGVLFVLIAAAAFAAYTVSSRSLSKQWFSLGHCFFHWVGFCSTTNRGEYYKAGTPSPVQRKLWTWFDCPGC